MLILVQDVDDFPKDDSKWMLLMKGRNNSSQPPSINAIDKVMRRTKVTILSSRRMYHRNLDRRSGRVRKQQREETLTRIARPCKTDIATGVIRLLMFQLKNLELTSVLIWGS